MISMDISPWGICCGIVVALLTLFLCVSSQGKQMSLDRRWKKNRVRTSSCSNTRSHNNNSNIDNNNNRNRNNNNNNNMQQRRRRKLENGKLPWRAAIVQIGVTMGFCLFMITHQQQSQDSVGLLRMDPLSCRSFLIQFVSIELLGNFIRQQLSRLPQSWIQCILSSFQTTTATTIHSGQRRTREENDETLPVLPQTFSIAIATILLKPHPFSISAFLMAAVMDHVSTACQLDNIGSIEIKLSANN